MKLIISVHGMMMDRLQTMSVFVCVAEESGFAAAARRLNMSAPTVTRAISELENLLGARLLHRTTRSLRLTEAGQRYLLDCRRILSEIEEANLNAAGIHSAPRGVVSVTASVPFGRMVLMPIMFELLDKYPEIQVSYQLHDRIVHLLEEGIDVAIRIAELPDSTFAAVRVGCVRRVLCASPTYLKKHGMPKHPRELADHRLIDFVNMAPGGEWQFHHDGEIYSHKPNSQLHVNKADVAIAGTVSGRGITRLFSYMISSELSNGELVAVLQEYEPPPLPVHVMHKELGQTSARVRAVVDHCVEQLRNHHALK
ncbi:MAG: LysR family transcriptional regulator [Rhizobiaceae bacterium]